MDKPIFKYVTYIRTTPEKVWEALTTPEFIRKYWSGFHIKSDWKVGSSVELIDAEGTLGDHGVVLRLERPYLLSYSWKNAWLPELRDERTSRVTFEITPEKPAKGTVRLTIVHDEFDPGSKLYEGIKDGWPAILSSLKSLLETGTALESETHLLKRILAERQKG
jgi:uncharacterized protein YndB with AHSA1/START domain